MIITLYVLMAVTAIEGKSHVNTITTTETRAVCDDIRLALINVPRDNINTEFICVKADVKAISK